MRRVLRTTLNWLSGVLGALFCGVPLRAYALESIGADAVDQCVKGVYPSIDPASQDFGKLKMILDFCYSKLFYQANFNAENVRQALFDRQIFENEIMLWMVVAITVSGVILAGVQLYTSYRLSLQGTNIENAPTELLVRKNELAVKSSTTGLLILIVSFGFFFVYVVFVFTLKEISSGNVASTETKPAGQGASKLIARSLTSPSWVPAAIVTADQKPATVLTPETPAAASTPPSN